MFSCRLRTTPRPKFSICVLADAQHCDEAKAADMPYMDIEALKKLNKNKKLVKKLGGCCMVYKYLFVFTCLEYHMGWVCHIGQYNKCNCWNVNLVYLSE